jgi:hypothetical protein
MNKGDATAKQRPTTHIVLDLLLGAGIDQQPHAVRVTIPSGEIQRCASALSVEFAAAHT